MRLIVLLLLLPVVTLADPQIEIGPTYLSGEHSEGRMVLLSERYDKWLVGIGWTSEQVVLPDGDREWGLPPTDVDYNLFIHGQRLIRWKKLEAGVGMAYFQNTNRVSTVNMMVSVSASFHFNRHLSLNFRHFSNAGSGTLNLGQDAVTIGWTF